MASDSEYQPGEEDLRLAILRARRFTEQAIGIVQRTPRERRSIQRLDCAFSLYRALHWLEKAHHPEESK